MRKSFAHTLHKNTFFPQGSRSGGALKWRHRAQVFGLSSRFRYISTSSSRFRYLSTGISFLNTIISRIGFFINKQMMRIIKKICFFSLMAFVTVLSVASLSIQVLSYVGISTRNEDRWQIYVLLPFFFQVLIFNPRNGPRHFFHWGFLHS